MIDISPPRGARSRLRRQRNPHQAHTIRRGFHSPGVFVDTFPDVPFPSALRVAGKAKVVIAGTLPDQA